MKINLDCKEVARLISDGQDGDLPEAERARMRLHFVAGQSCRNVDEQTSFLRHAMHRLGRDEPANEQPPKA